MSPLLGSQRDAATKWVEVTSTRTNAWLGRRKKLNNWVTLGREVIVAHGASRISLAAAGAAFWLVIALFPTVTAAVSLFGLIFTPQDVANAMNEIDAPGADTFTTLISDQAQNIAGSTASSLSFTLVASVLVALWSVSNGSYNLVRAIRLAFGVPNLPYFKSRLRAFVGGIVIVVGLGVLAFLFSELRTLDNKLAAPFGSLLSVLVIWPLFFVLLVGGIVGAYRFATSKSGRHLPSVPGAVFSTIALALLGWGMAVAFAGLGTASSVYGIAASGVSALITAYLAMYLVLLGALINAHWPGLKQLVPGRGREDSAD